jgi:hypothetical protein
MFPFTEGSPCSLMHLNNPDLLVEDVSFTKFVALRFYLLKVFLVLIIWLYNIISKCDYLLIDYIGDHDLHLFFLCVFFY